MNQLFYSTIIDVKKLFLEDQEASHCAQVLRKNVGDEIEVVDGNGNYFTATISGINKKKVEADIITTKHIAQTENLSIAVGPTKNRDRLEWMVEKLVEIGVKEIILLNTKNTERTRTNFSRLTKKALAAMKQSLRFYLPSITELDFSEILNSKIDNKYIAHCVQDGSRKKLLNNSGEERLILIGPEGDFNQSEIDEALNAGFIPVQLGDYRLRTETAAIVAATLLQ